MAQKKGKPNSAQLTRELLHNGPHRLIMIPASQSKSLPYGQRDVFVSINGYRYSIRRGHKVAVPEPVAQRLELAERQTMTLQEQSNGKWRMAPETVRDYPFQDYGPCTREGKALYETQEDKPRRGRKPKAAEVPAVEMPEMAQP